MNTRLLLILEILYGFQTECDIIKLAVCDYIAGMTDRYAVTKFEDLFIPKSAQTKKSDEQIFKLIGISGIYAK